MYNGHLSIEEVDELNQQKGPAENQTHVENCQQCRLLLEKYKAVSAKLDKLASAHIGARNGMNCPDEKVWFEVVGGTLPSDKSLQYVQHAAECSSCSQKLKAATRMFEEELSPEEEQALAALPGAAGKAQRSLAERLAGTGGKRTRVVVEKPKRSFWKPLSFSLAGAAVATLVLFSYIAWRNSLTHVERLLANAYAERRIIELRIDGSQHVPMRVKRSGGDTTDEPQALKDADAIISRELNAHPENAKWLHARGKVELLKFQYDAAIKDLERVQTLSPDSTSVMIDLATAYYERAKATDTAIDFQTAVSYLSNALAKAPDDKVAIFNRAICEEEMKVFTSAVEDWQHYIQLDPASPWAEEARRHLAAVEKRIDEKQKSISKPLLAPAYIRDSDWSANIAEELDARVEEYLHVALEDWLPRAYPADSQRPPDTDARVALVKLSRITRSKHGDAWLEDLLADAREQDFGAAVNALSEAVAANDRGDYDEAHRESALAERFFMAQHNLPGVLQARFQRLFSLQFIRNGQRCARAAMEAARTVLQTPYSWLQAQILLEESACLSTNVDIGQARSQIARAFAISQTNKYWSTSLRCLNFSAASEARFGEMRIGWTQALEGLDKFWAGNYPALRGYSLYTSLALLAERAACPHLQVAAWTEAIALIDSDSDLLQRGMAHFYLAQAAMDAHLLSLFDREYQEYNRLLDLAPAGGAQRADRNEVQLVTAKLEIRRGFLHQAHDRLTALLLGIQDSGNTYRAADIYATLGQLEVQLGAREEADRHLRSGLLVTEYILGTLHTEKERIEWERKASPVYRALVEEKLREGNATSALEIWEWYLGAAIREPNASSSSPAKFLFSRVSADRFSISRLTTVNAHLPRLTRQTVLSYALMTDGLAIWAFDNRGIFYAYVHRDPREIEQRARRFLELCADPISDVAIVNKYGQDLYSILIAPIVTQLESDRGLIVEADGVLSLVPFEALVDPAFRYLGKERTVVSSLGLYYDLLLRPLRPILQADVGLVVGVPSPKGFTPLPDLETETEMVASQFSKPIVLTKKDATLQAVLRALPYATVFYFAGHAVATPDRTGLLMADIDPNSDEPRLLTADLLKPESLKRLQIVVLAACDTTKGNDGNYNDVTSLVRTMIRAGVPSVVASRWDIISGAPDRLTLPFVFPQKVPQTSAHPYYWASLNQFGGLDVIQQ